jgi:hypothetical protein
MLPPSAQDATSPLVRSLEGQPLQQQKPQPISRMKKKFPLLKFFVTLIIILLTISAAGYFFVYRPGLKLISSAKNLENSVKLTTGFVKSQDLKGLQIHLQTIKGDLDKVGTELQSFSWTNSLPYLGEYYKDGGRGLTAAKETIAAGELGIAAIAPYADIIGLKGLSTTGDGAKTAQDRINFIINTLDKIKPQLSDIGVHLQNAKEQVDKIDPSRYPEEIKGIKLREQLSGGITLLDQASVLVNDAKPLLEAAPYMLGMKSSRKYLIIFQNDAELRPTGGFMTAYAVLSVDKGKISTVLSDDIYALDAKFTKKIPAPAPILKYLPKVPYWYLRDQNISPDFKVSMDTFFPNYQLTKSPQVDGIIAVNTQVLVDLLKITGPIGVPNFGTYSAETDKRCNCPQAFYELELFADVEGPVVWDSVSGQIVYKPQNYGERKSFVGPFMYSILANVMAQPKNKMGDLFNTVINLVQQKHILFYFSDENTQKAVETFNMAGRVQDYDKDYLMVVDTNFAGAKTNAWVTYKADQKINVGSDGTVTKTLTLTYNNPQPFFEDEKTKLRLNGVFRDWLRVYVPKGSTLIEATGFETGQSVGEDLGKTVFEGFFTLTPTNVKTITLKYNLPFKMKSPYSLLIQKQAGSKVFPYRITINGKSQPELLLSSDKQLTF